MSSDKLALLSQMQGGSLGAGSSAIGAPLLAGAPAAAAAPAAALGARQPVTAANPLVNSALPAYEAPPQLPSSSMLFGFGDLVKQLQNGQTLPGMSGQMANGYVPQSQQQVSPYAFMNMQGSPFQQFYQAIASGQLPMQQAMQGMFQAPSGTQAPPTGALPPQPAVMPPVAPPLPEPVRRDPLPTRVRRDPLRRWGNHPNLDMTRL